MQSFSTETRTTQRDIRGTTGVLAVSAVVCVGLVAFGLALPVIPERIHTVLGFNALTVGWVMGAQAVAALVSRPWAGTRTDRHGGKQTVMIGLLAMSGCGLANLASTILGLSADVSLSLLVVGRVLTGVAQGLIVTGGAAWAIGLAETTHAGRAMSWLGLAIFAGLAAGAALGTEFDQAFDFVVVTAAMIFLPLASFGGASFIASSGQRRDLSPTPILETIVTIRQPGLTLALASVGYAAVTSFVVLDFNAHAWSGGGMALVAFSGGHVAARLGFGAIVDRIKGPVAAAITLTVEAVGLGLIWAAPNPAVALAGAGISGFGFSMVYPLLALAALRCVPPSRTGAVIGIYDAYYDVAMGLSGLLSGALAERFGITAPFLFAGAASLIAIGFAARAYGQGRYKS